MPYRPARQINLGELSSLELIRGFFKSLKIRALAT
jgi:hypothetical protein